MGVYVWTDELKNAYIWEYVEWWQPWANTVAYYPLNSISTVNDMSGNNHNLTNNNVVFWTYQWVDCWYFDSRWSSSWLCWLYNSSFYPWDSVATRTVSVRFYASWNTVYNNPRLMAPIAWAKDKWNKIIAGRYNDWDIDWANFNVWEWTHVIFIWDSNNYYDVYKNWVLQHSNVYTAYLVQNIYLTIWTRENNGTSRWDKRDGGISEVIIEDKRWTAQEVANYYNQTKSLYGIA